MELLDIHTHNRSANKVNGILSYSILDGEFPDNAQYMSFSIHPWYITKGNISFQLESLKASILSEKRIVAVGECGIDKACNTPLDLQVYAFQEAAKIARDNSLPLIIHSVKSSNEIIEIRKKIGYDAVWIIHGFRKKTDLAQAFLKHNINLSFGENYNSDALRTVPLQNLFLETDESKLPIDDIARNVAQGYGISVDELKEKVSENISRCFPSAFDIDTLNR